MIDKKQTKQKQSSNMVVVIIYCYMGCKDKATTTLYFNGFPDGIGTLGQQYNVGEKPTVICTLILIAMQSHQT